MPYPPRSRWLVTVLLTATSLGSAITAAELLSGGNPPAETLTIQTGDILEILPVHTFPSATYSWILTQDRNFLEVGRNAFYSTRLINPGRFTLNAEVSSPVGQTALRRVFTIDVQPRQAPPTENVPPTDPDAPLVRTQHGEREDRLIILPENQATLLLTPLDDALHPLHIDLDAQHDTNDDDILTNDIDNAETFFQTSGTPLYLWFTAPLGQREVTIHARSPDGLPLSQSLSVLSTEYAKQRGLIVSRVQVQTEEQGPKTLLFSPRFEDGSPPSLPLVFHWDFGDGTESIEEHPLHEYQTYGTYTVHLSIRNIETGQELATRTVELPLQAPLIQEPNPNLLAPVLPPEPGPLPEKTSFLSTIFTIIGVAIGLIALGFFAAWISAKVKRLFRRKKEQPSSPALVPSQKQQQPSLPAAVTPPPPPPPTASPATSPSPNWLKKAPPTPTSPLPSPAPPIQPKPVPSPPTAVQPPAPPQPVPPPPPKPAASAPAPVPPKAPKPPAPVPVLKPSAPKPPPPALPKVSPPPPPPPPTAPTAPTVPAPKPPPVPTTPTLPTVPTTSPPNPQQPAPPSSLPPTSKGTADPPVAIVRVESIEQQKPGNPPKV